MKNKFTNLLLAGAAFTALTGTGFGVWVFETNLAQDTVASNFDLTPACLVGDNLIANTTGTYILDQKDDVGTVDVTLAVSTKWTMGEIGTVTNSATAGETYTYTYTEDTNKVETKVDYTYNVTIDLGALCDYLKVTEVKEADDTDITTSLKVEDEITLPTTDQDALFVNGFSVTLDWVDGKKPTNISDYNTLKAVCQTGQIAFTVSNFDVTLAD